MKRRRKRSEKKSHHNTCKLKNPNPRSQMTLPGSIFLPFLVFLLASRFLGLGFSQNSSCPLDFTVLQKFLNSTDASQTNMDRCQYALQAIHLVQAQYLRTNGLFLPSPNSSASCWDSFEPNLRRVFPGFNPRPDCGFQTSWISQGCMNITSRSEFESKIPKSAIGDLKKVCNQSLANSSPCAACTTSLNRLKATYLPGPDNGNVSDCTSYPLIYAAGVSPSGPADDGNALCFFLLSAASSPGPPSSSNGPPDWIYGVISGFLFILVLAGLLYWFKWKKKKRKRKKNVGPDVRQHLDLESISASTTLIRFTFEEIKAATKNFSRENIIGKGGYGNVYKGTLLDGDEVAIKRFKNCSLAGDASFTHEVEVIASVRHVNLVALRGYCTATTSLEGHQRMIVCDLMRNGSLHDHLFVSTPGTKLSWPVRQKIAIGTARGLAYLHCGAQPTIIHRDIKASNILLDEGFEPKVADFGLAKFAPEGISHLSTRVAGTLGYVAPEYALYGQLTEKSDVYSFGVLLLELLSGKKAFISNGGGQTTLVTDWAWSLVRNGRTLDVIEDGMDDLGPNAVMEKYVLVAVLSSHPQMYARPTMDQVVKILETDSEVPLIPDRPIPLTSDMSDIEKSVSSSGSGHLSSFGGYQPFTMRSDNLSSPSQERE